MKPGVEQKEHAWAKWALAATGGCLVGALCCTFFLMVCALALAASAQVPQGLLSPLTLAVCGLSAFAAGMTAAKLSGERGLPCGAAAGLLLFLLISLAGYFLVQEPFSAALATKGAVMALAGALGGVLMVNRRPRRK